MANSKYVPNRNVIPDKRKKKEEEKKTGYRYDKTGKKITSSDKNSETKKNTSSGKSGEVKKTSPSSANRSSGAPKIITRAEAAKAAMAGNQQEEKPVAPYAPTSKSPKDRAIDYLYKKYGPSDQQIMQGVGNNPNKDYGTKAYHEKTWKGATEFQYDQIARGSNPTQNAQYNYFDDLAKAAGGNKYVLDTKRKEIENLKKQGETDDWWLGWTGLKKQTNKSKIKEAEDQYQDYKNSLRMFGFDSVNAALNSEDPNAAAAKSIIDKQYNYTSNDMADDLVTIDDALRYGTNKGSEFDAAVERLNAYYGRDVLPYIEENHDPGGMWMNEFLESYDGDRAELDAFVKTNSGVSGTDAEISANDMFAYRQAVDNQIEKETKLAEWNVSRDAMHNSFMEDPEYDVFSQHIPRGDWYTSADDSDNGIETWDDASMLNDLVNAVHTGEYDKVAEEISGTQRNDIAAALIDYIRYMSPDDVSDFNYIMNTSGFDEAFKFITEDIMWNLGRQYEDEKATRIQQDIAENPWTAIPYSVTSFGDMLASGIGGVASFINPITGQELNEYHPLLSWSRSMDTKRGATTAMLENEFENASVAGFHVPSMLYNGAMSAADSAINTAIYGHMATPMMAFSAYGSSLYQNLESMGNGAGAYIDAAVDGGIEALTEYFSVEGLLDDAVSSGLKTFGKQLVTEPSEEVFGKLLRFGYDTARNGENSEVNRQINELIAQGYSESEAEAIAARDFARKLGETIFTSAISGAAGGARNAIQQGAANYQAGKQFKEYGDDDDYQVLIDIGKTVPLTKSQQRIMETLDAEIAARKAQQTAEEQEQEAPKPEINPAERLNDMKPQEREAPPVTVFDHHRQRKKQNDIGTEDKETEIAPEETAEQETSKPEINPTERLNDMKPQEREAPPVTVLDRHRQIEKQNDIGTEDKETETAPEKTAEQETPEAVEEQAENIAEEIKENPEANADKAADKMTKAAKGKGGKKVTKAQLGMLYRSIAAKLDEKAQDALRERMSFNVAKELRQNGVKGEEAKSLATSMLRIQDGNFTEEDFEAVQNNPAARSVLAEWTKKVDADNEAQMKLAQIRALMPSRPMAASGSTKTNEKDAIEANDEFAVKAAEVEEKAKGMQMSEGEDSTIDGEAVKIVGAAPAGIADGGNVAMIRVVTPDGEERIVDADSIAYSEADSAAYDLAQYATSYGANADIMYGAYQAGQDVGAYAAAFDIAARHGSDGRNINTLLGGSVANVLTENQIKTAYELGRGMRAQRSQQAQAARSRKGAGVKTGNVDTSAIADAQLNKHQRATVKAMESVAELLGINVRFVESKADAKGRYTTENGSWDANTRTLTVDIHAGSNLKNDVHYSMMDTVGHELTHYIRQLADSKLWDEYQDFVMSHLGEKMDLGKEIEKKLAQNENLNRDDAIEEIIADASAQALSRITDQQIAEMAQSNPNLFKKIAAFIKKWVSDFRKQIRKAFSTQEAAANRFARAMEDSLDEMAAKWNAMLVNASRTANAEKVQDGPVAVQAQQKAQAAAQNDGNVKLSMREPVESTKNLIAVHNLTASKLSKALKLGGFPMPSIAITKADIGHTNFGDISLVFGKETIDPEFMRRNTVYSADAWTPTFPRIEYEADSKAEKRIKDKYYDLARKHGYDYVRPMYGIANTLEDELNRYGGEEELIDHFRDDTEMMQVFIIDTQGKPVEKITRENVYRIEPEVVEKYDYFIEKLGEDVILETRPNGKESPMKIRKAWLEKHGDALEQAYLSYLVDVKGIDYKTAQDALENVTNYDRVMEVVAARNYIINGAEKITVETDVKASEAAIRKAATGYEEWLESLLRGVVKDSGVYNNKDLYTTSGNRRSFKQTHYSVTLKNIARAMAEQNGGNSRNVSGFYGVKSLRAGTAKRFSSIAEMHQLEDRLQNLSEAEAEAINDALAERLTVLMNEIYNTKSHNKTGSDFMAMDAIGNMLMEAAELSNKSIENIKKICADYYYNLNDSIAQEIRELLFDVEQMPVRIFEAKPERAVGFDEVRFAVVPDDIDSDVLNALREAVSDVRTYPAGDEAARVDMLNAAEDVKFQMRDPSEVSDREMLVSMLDNVNLSVEDRNRLNVYRERIGELNEKQQLLEQATTKISMLRKADEKGNREEIIKLQNQAEVYAKQIERADAKLMEIEALKPIKEMAKRQRAAYIESVKSGYDERLQKYKQKQKEKIDERIAKIKEREAGKRKDMRKEMNRLKNAAEPNLKERYRNKILSDVKKLYSWVATPTNKAHVPEFLKAPLGEFIQSIDFSSADYLKNARPGIKDISMAEALEKLRRVLANVHNQKSIEEGAEEQFGYMDLPAQYLEQLDVFVGNVKEALQNAATVTDTPLMLLNSDQLAYLSEAIAILKHSVEKMNENFNKSQFESPRSTANATIEDMYKLKAKVKTNKMFETINSMYNWKNTTPYYAFQRMGKGGKAIFEALQDGWDKMAQNSAILIDYAQEAFTQKQAKAWSKDIKTIQLANGDEIKMTASQIMSMYCLNKREQAVGHMLGGGIRIEDINLRAGNTLHDVDNHTLTESDINKILNLLTPEQMSVANKLQEFMNTTCTDWGNEISMKRFGYKMFTEKFYFPIEVDANNLGRSEDKQENKKSMFRLLNMSAMKPLTPKANNALVVRDIFDVFTEHTTDIAKYNALALPILDTIRWFNYTDKSEVMDKEGNRTGQIKARSTQKALEHAYGKNAKDYIRKFMEDLNAEHDGGRNDGVLQKLMGNAKAASVGWNARVYFLQITSLPRAAYAINPKYLLKGLAKIRSLNPVNAIKGTEAQDKIGIMKWKSLGFYNTDIARSTRSMVRRDEGFLSKLRGWGMKPAEWGDNWVGNIIYEAAKAEMKDKHPSLQPGSNAYDAMLNKRVREIVYKTQVVDSTMTRSDFMRSKGMMQMFTSFMSEPTLTVNMLNESIQEIVAKHRTGVSVKESIRSVGGKTMKAAAVFVFTATFSAIVEALFDAIRDDDEYETFMEKFMQGLFGEKASDADGAWGKFKAVFDGNIGDNVNIFAMLPLIKEGVSLLEGYEENSMVTQVAKQFIDVKDSIEAWQEGKRPLYDVIYKGFKTIGSATGVGIQNVSRDGVGLYNTFLADAIGQPKVQTYENTKSDAAAAYYDAITKGDTDKAAWVIERAAINGLDTAEFAEKMTGLVKADYAAGKIDADTATKYLESYAGKNRNDAHWLLKEWDYTGDGNFSEYNDLRTALTAGSRSDAQTAYNELIKYGKTEKAINTQISAMYNDGRATNMLSLQLRSNNLYTSTVKLKADGEKHPDDFDAFITAIVNGSGIEREADKLFEKGYTVKQCMTAINGAFGNEKDIYRTMEMYNSREAAILMDRILDGYEAIGLDRQDEIEWIEDNWKM